MRNHKTGCGRCHRKVCCCQRPVTTSCICPPGPPGPEGPQGPPGSTGAQGPAGDDLIVPDIATLMLLGTATGLEDGERAIVLTVDQEWELDPDSTETVDGITVVAASGGGNWLRNETFSKKWSLAYLAGAYVDPFAGDDENDGLAEFPGAPGSRIGPTQTLAEIARRLHQAQAGQNYQINIVDTAPVWTPAQVPGNVGGVPVEDRFRPFFFPEGNQEAVNATNGIEQTINFTLIGRTRVLATSAFANYAPTAVGVEAQLQDTSQPGLLAANIGNMFVITAPGAQAGNVGFIGATTAEDAAIPANTARVSDVVNPATGVAAPALGGGTYDIVQNTPFGPSILQLPSNGRYVLQNLDFVAPAASPADQLNVSIRLATVNANQCKWRRNVDVSFGLFGALGCLFTDASGAGTSGTRSLLSVAQNAAVAFQFSLALNVLVELVNDSVSTLQNFYLEKSNLVTFAQQSIPSYGNFIIGAGGSRGSHIQIAGPLAIYNWLTGTIGFRIRDRATVKASALIMGKGVVAGDVAVFVEGDSELMISDAVSALMPTQGIGAVVAQAPVATVQIVISNPDGAGGEGGLQAIAQDQIPLVAGPVTLTAAAMQTWTQWAAAPFFRHAFNLANGARVASFHST